MTVWNLRTILSLYASRQHCPVDRMAVTERAQLLRIVVQPEQGSQIAFLHMKRTSATVRAIARLVGQIALPCDAAKQLVSALSICEQRIDSLAGTAENNGRGSIRRGNLK